MKILLVVGLIGILLFFFLNNIDLRQVKEHIATVNLLYPFLFLLGLYLQFFIRAYRWGILLKPHKEKIPIFTLYNYTVIGFLLNLLPGKIGEPARGILLAGEEKISRSYGLASVVLERLIDSALIVLFFLLSLFFIENSNSPFLSGLKKASFFIFPLIVLFFVIFYLINTDKLFGRVEKFIRFFSRILPARIRERAVHFALNFVKGLRLHLSPFDFLKLLISSLMVWLFLIPFYWLLMKGFGFGTEVTLIETLTYFTVIAASAAIPTPGMAGSFDAVSRVALEEICKVDGNLAVAYTILAHFLILTAMVVPGIIALWIKGINFQTIKGLKEKKEEK